MIVLIVVAVVILWVAAAVGLGVILGRAIDLAERRK